MSIYDVDKSEFEKSDFEKSDVDNWDHLMDRIGRDDVDDVDGVDGVDEDDDDILKKKSKNEIRLRVPHCKWLTIGLTKRCDFATFADAAFHTSIVLNRAKYATHLRKFASVETVLFHPFTISCVFHFIFRVGAVHLWHQHAASYMVRYQSTFANESFLSNLGKYCDEPIVLHLIIRWVPSLLHSQKLINTLVESACRVHNRILLAAIRHHVKHYCDARAYDEALHGMDLSDEPLQQLDLFPFLRQWGVDAAISKSLEHAFLTKMRRYTDKSKGLVAAARLGCVDHMEWFLSQGPHPHSAMQLARKWALFFKSV